MKTVRKILPAALALAALLLAMLLLKGRGVAHPSPTDPASAELTATSPPAKTRERSSSSKPSPLVGMTITDAAKAEEWAAKLSRNEHEYAQRLTDLRHLRKAEVIEFKTIAENASRLSTDQLPLTLSLPSFGGGSMEVTFDHLAIDGPAGGTMAGKIVGQPDSTVVLGFHNGETSGVIEGPGKIVFLDAFDQEVAILRELDAEAHAKDFECDCMLHQSQREHQPR
ncbi:hypothetical protein OKA05_15275 [Luteolibacter arcticus]|uniref:Uncharacterized protein n=1 Tax=Luteolibacter arcticus TaxID=1581411 RepID=A0ABT3GK78_9BACT|nr:hypothetical protein [Luteolibacter arcticus]MCW1923929.1 hypothetical protein [Luteolibacter arcticus]